MNALISPDLLAQRLGKTHILDATLLDPALGRDARAEFEAAHIPGAAFLDLATLRDMGDPLPNTMPSADAFARRLSALGIGRNDPIVVYDNAPWRSAARAWFMLRHFGASDVTLLDGGWAGWLAGGFPVEAGPSLTAPSPFAATTERADLRSLAEVSTALESDDAQLVDARSAVRFTGAEPDPHGAAAGHMPGARNLPYPQLFQSNGRWKRGEALARAFRDAGVDPDRPVIATCGSGITAAVLVFGLHLLGRDAALYDGSWSEWGSHPDTPKARG